MPTLLSLVEAEVVTVITSDAASDDNADVIKNSHLPMDPFYKSHDALDKYPIMHHCVTEMCTHVHISATKWCIVGYGTGALWDLCDSSIDSPYKGLQYLERPNVNTSSNQRYSSITSSYDGGATVGKGGDPSEDGSTAELPSPGESLLSSGTPLNVSLVNPSFVWSRVVSVCSSAVIDWVSAKFRSGRGCAIAVRLASLCGK